MQSIRRRLSIILILCSITAVILSALFVNIAVNNTFNRYMSNIQDRRNARLVEYLQQVYRKEGKWNEKSGEEMMHEAYMSNYCLTLLDSKKEVVWGMNPNDIKEKTHILMHGGEEKGVYTSQTFTIDVEGKTVGYIVVGQYYPVLLSQEDINFKTSINQSIILSVLTTTIIVAFVSVLISKQFSAPIRAVSDTSVDLTKGKYESRSKEKSSIKELNNLIESINILGDKLKSQDLLRKRLVSDISHEIRTPLNILQNNLEGMIDGIVPITEEKLNGLNEEVIRFGKLLSNLNALKEIEQEEELTIEDVNIDEILLLVCNDFSPIAKEKKIEFRWSFQEEKEYRTRGNRDQLKQVFINLLSNAIKFTKENGHIQIQLVEEKEKIIIRIQDDGIGIKKKDLPFIFERLYRADKSRNETEGSGLGLTIVKRILMIHGGTIEVRSEEGKGTEFTLYFSKIN